MFVLQIVFVAMVGLVGCLGVVMVECLIGVAGRYLVMVYALRGDD